MTDPQDAAVDLERLRRRYERQRAALNDAEAVAERVTSELYATVNELQRVNDELEHANQSMREFVAIASHDLRGPLTSLLGYTQIMQRRWAELSDEQKIEFLGVMEGQGRRLERLVGDLLTLSKIEAGAMELHLETLVVAHELAKAVGSLGDDAGAVSVLAPSDLSVVADPDHVQRIVTNYISNAMKYGAPPIVAQAQLCDAFVDVCVRDAGDGVPEEFRTRLFGRFARADRPGSREGTGLGLSIVRGLARANGGDAWYEPNTPTGSCFIVRLPKAG